MWCQKRVPAASRLLIPTSRRAARFTPSEAAAARPAIPLAPITARADEHLAPASGTEKQAGIVHRSPRRGELDDPPLPGNTALGAVRKCGSGRSLGHDRQVSGVRGCVGLLADSDLTATHERRHRRCTRRRRPLTGNIGSGGEQRHARSGAQGRSRASLLRPSRVSSRRLFAEYPRFYAAANKAVIAVREMTAREDRLKRIIACCFSEADAAFYRRPRPAPGSGRPPGVVTNQGGRQRKKGTVETLRREIRAEPRSKRGAMNDEVEEALLARLRWRMASAVAETTGLIGGKFGPRAQGCGSHSQAMGGGVVQVAGIRWNLGPVLQPVVTHHRCHPAGDSRKIPRRGRVSARRGGVACSAMRAPPARRARTTATTACPGWVRLSKRSMEMKPSISISSSRSPAAISR